MILISKGLGTPGCDNNKEFTTGNTGDPNVTIYVMAKWGQFSLPCLTYSSSSRVKCDEAERLTKHFGGSECRTEIDLGKHGVCRYRRYSQVWASAGENAWCYAMGRGSLAPASLTLL